MSPDSERRNGLKLIELMVIVAIIGLTLGLIIPAQLCTNHGCSRRCQCMNNLRQVGLGLEGYVNMYGCYPNAGTFAEDPVALAKGDPAKSVINDVFSNQPSSHGYRGVGYVGPLHSWVVDILPYFDSQAIYNHYNRNASYLDTNSLAGTTISNRSITSEDIPTLLCPNDDTNLTKEGDLSYVVNGGFSRWHAQGRLYGWAGDKTSGSNGPKLDWGQRVATQTGVMFLGTARGKAPWDYRTTPGAIVDGASTTVLLSENIRAGASNGNRYSMNQPTNWACPHPNFTMFIGSDDVCTKGGSPGVNCTNVGDLGMTGGKNGPGWSRSNSKRNYEGINAGRNSPDEGSSPFPNSGHIGIVIVTMCDGSTRIIQESIDGGVWAKLLTPAGGSLSPAYAQTPIGLRELD
jgi:type II secretory pathway pseudopilin PulG